MMRTRTRVGVAVRREEDGEIVTEGFTVEPPTGRWTRWPFMRGVVAIHTALKTGQKSMAIGERLRWEELPKGETAAEEIAKEAGLEGAAFIVADAAIRLVLLLGTLLLLSVFRPFRKILKYHGAEHQAIAAFEAGR